MRKVLMRLCFQSRSESIVSMIKWPNHTATQLFEVKLHERRMHKNTTLCELLYTSEFGEDNNVNVWTPNLCILFFERNSSAGKLLVHQLYTIHKLCFTTTTAM